MPITVAALITRANDLLNDTTNIRWTQPELLRWLNDGQREVVLNIPAAGAVNSPVLLVAGTKQTIPASGIRLLDVVRNLGATGLVPGRAVRVTERESLDAMMPDWHAYAATAPVRHFMFDERDPRHFYTYPPVPATQPVYVEMIYSAAPAECILGGSIGLDDIYGNVLLDYVCYRAWSKDADTPAAAQKAQSYYALVANALGIKHKGDVLSSPNTSNQGGTPPRNAG